MTIDGLVTPAAKRFDPPTLRHLMQLFFEANGAAQAAQTALNVSQAAQARFREALVLACDQLDVPAPTGKTETFIDWRTGEFEFKVRED